MFFCKHVKISLRVKQSHLKESDYNVKKLNLNYNSWKIFIKLVESKN